MVRNSVIIFSMVLLSIFLASCDGRHGTQLQSYRDYLRSNRGEPPQTPVKEAVLPIEVPLTPIVKVAAPANTKLVPVIVGQKAKE